MAQFLCKRAVVLTDLERYQQAIEAFFYACELHPENQTYSGAAVELLDHWKGQVQRVLPPRFPRQIEVLLRKDRRRWPGVSCEMEREVAAVHATEWCLHYPRHVEWWWTPLSNGMAPLRDVPSRITVDYEQITLGQ